MSCGKIEYEFSNKGKINKSDDSKNVWFRMFSSELCRLQCIPVLCLTSGRFNIYEASLHLLDPGKRIQNTENVIANNGGNSQQQQKQTSGCHCVHLGVYDNRVEYQK